MEVTMYSGCFGEFLTCLFTIRHLGECTQTHSLIYTVSPDHPPQAQWLMSQCSCQLGGGRVEPYRPRVPNKDCCYPSLCSLSLMMPSPWVSVWPLRGAIWPTGEMKLWECYMPQLLSHLLSVLAFWCVCYRIIWVQGHWSNRLVLETAHSCAIDCLVSCMWGVHTGCHAPRHTGKY